MRPLILLISIISLSIASCKKDDLSDKSSRAFIVTQRATCSSTIGNPNSRISEISNLNPGDVYIAFDSPTFAPAPNTWYRIRSSSGMVLGRYKTGSDVSPKNAPYFLAGGDMNPLTVSNLCD